MRPGTTVVIPAKGLDTAKSRLQLPDDERRRVARVLLNRTVETVIHTPEVGLVLVVTSDPVLGGDAAARGAGVVHEKAPFGLNQALAFGCDRAIEVRPFSPVACLVADLPTLEPAELAAVIDEYWFDETPLFVADHIGSGTTMLIQGPTRRLPILFGSESARAHRSQGYRDAKERVPTLRWDLDTATDLAAVSGRPS